MKVEPNKTHRLMVGVPADDPNKVLDAKFRMASVPYSYGYFENIHYWSFPVENRDQCLSILTSVFPDIPIHHFN